MPHTPKYTALLSGLTDVIQQQMPWPFDDVARESQEGRESAAAIAHACIPTIVSEFNALRKAERRTRA